MSQGSTQLVAGRYQLTRMIGRGGMGSVWEGVHTSLGTRVAVKFIDGELAEAPEARQRFQNEARAAAKLQSRYVVQIHDHGVMDDGRPFIVMEYLEGEPLDSRLSRVGRLSAPETARILGQVARGLAKAHELGIVHRDLKPENIFMVRSSDGDEEIAKIVDFGIAKITDTGAGISASTRTGSVIGTPFYMSPEQVRGLKTVDHRTDVWAFGVVAYQCLTGQHAFSGESTGDLLVKICTVPTPTPSLMFQGISPAFDAWLARSLAKEPAERFSSVTEQANELAAIAGLSGPHVAPPLSAPSHAPSAPGVAATVSAYEVAGLPKRRSGALPIVLVGAVMLAIGVGGALLVVGNKGKRARREASAAAVTTEAPATAAPPATSEASPIVAPAATSTAAPPEPPAPTHPRKHRPGKVAEPPPVRPEPPPIRPEPPKPPPKTSPGKVDLGY
ncbi:MAG: serine/threonine protein kinase [Polyangiaceae bacterium]|nr:serine/threonine protein kinase [Polyangiaceae bacterium]